MAIEFQEVLILESWRGAVDCVETLLSTSVTVFSYFLMCMTGCLWVGGVWFEILMEGRMVMRGFLEARTGIA